MNKTGQKRPKRKTTGRFETREDLERHIWLLWSRTASKTGQIAKWCHISYGTANTILEELIDKYNRGDMHRENRKNR